MLNKDEGVTQEKVEHKNIFAALSAFQGENLTIERTKEFGKDSDKMHFFYAPLDEVLKTIRPSLAKHGLSFVHVGGGKDNAEMVCVLYHETYTQVNFDGREIKRFTAGGALGEIEMTPLLQETNVIRSLGIKVKRDGDMKEIGKESTYARRYTLAEVLGIAPDEDNDVAETKEKLEAAQSAMYTRVRDGIIKAKELKELTASANVLDRNLTDLANGKKSSLGLDKEQLDGLMQLVATRRSEFARGAVGRGAPGDNKDAGGEAELSLDGVGGTAGTGAAGGTGEPIVPSIE